MRRFWFSNERAPTESEVVFSRIFRANGFMGRESVSGPGSNLDQTKIIRHQLPLLLRELKCKTMLDAPCGDYLWMKFVNMPIRKYIGADVVKEIVEFNKSEFGDSKHKFVCLDITLDKLPKVDLIFCRDCLVHLPNDLVLACLSNFKKSNSQYLLTTTFTEHSENRDLPMGYWRPLNLQKPPFDLQQPLKIINEECSEDYGIFSDKSLGLWNLSRLS